MKIFQRMMNIQHYKLLAATLSVAFILSAKAQDPLPVPVMPVSNFAPPVTPDSIVIAPTDNQGVEKNVQPWGEQIRTRLNAFANEANRAPYNVGISVFDLTDDIPVWNYNSHKVLRPASTQKVLTAITALSVLGAKHEFRTRSYYTGTIAADGTLQGDVYVVGDFDPMYSHTDLKELARAIRDLGIKRISGKIYGDSSMKNADLYGNGWCWDDVPSKYEPYLCALMVERGREYPNFGTYSKSASFHPAAHFAYSLGQELKNLGITGVSAQVVPYGTKDYPGGGNNFHTKARTVEEVMQRMLKNSDNLHAEAVFFKVANAVAGKRASWKDGAKQVETLLRRAGVTLDNNIEVADGSGVSLYNYCTPEAQVAMLRYAYRNASILPVFYGALPIAGVDGTLDERMQSGPAYRNVHAKTGTLEGVIALTGYVTASNGHQLAFSILINGTLSSKDARAYQDRFCQELAR